eukprot:SAG31_NODE_3290_length_4457_cov_5.521570_1_plen_143_part_00
MVISGTGGTKFSTEEATKLLPPPLLLNLVPGGYLSDRIKRYGAGFAESHDGLHWEALPAPGPAVDPSLRGEFWGSHSAEVGGVCQLGGRVFMTFDAGHLYEASSALGPFVEAEANFNFLTGETGAVFPRLWGGASGGTPTTR